MRLWHPNDPYGLDTVRRVLLWFALAVVVIGALRVVVKDEPLVPFLAYAALIALVGLIMEPLVAWATRRRDARPPASNEPVRPASGDRRS